MSRQEPKYLQIKHYLLSKWQETGAIGQSDLEPFTETGLAKQFDVSRLTARHALKDLEKEGLVYSVRGLGTFFSNTKIKGQLKTLERFYAEWIFQGKDVDVNLLRIEHNYQAPVKIALALKIAISDNVTYIERIRSIDGVPIVYDQRFLPEEIGVRLSEDNVTKGHLYEVVTNLMNISVGPAKMEIEAILCDKSKADLLNINQGDPLLVRSVIINDTDNNPIIVGSSFYRADLYKYVVNLP